LIIGDSISIGYTPYVEEAFKGTAEVFHNPGNAQHTGKGLSQIKKWIYQENWDVIHFNWGLWDLCYRLRESKEQGNKDKINGQVTYSLGEYRQNMGNLVKILKTTNARLIFATTTYVPKGEPGRFEGDDEKYNAVAVEIMKKNGVAVNDLNPFSKLVHQQEAKAGNDVHYTEKGYELLAQAVIIEILKQ